MGFDRIWVTGNAGAGKTSLAEDLGEVLGLPVFSLDSIVWEPGWTKASDDVKQSKIADLTSQDQWAVDGVSPTGMRRADVVVFIDLPRRLVARRAFKRNIRFLFKSRPGLPENCPEILILRRLIKVIWRFPKHARPHILDSVAAASSDQLFIHIRTPAEQRAFRDALRAAGSDLANAQSVLLRFSTEPPPVMGS